MTTQKRCESCGDAIDTKTANHVAMTMFAYGSPVRRLLFCDITCVKQWTLL